jgi:hypothetical protein
MVSVLKSAFWRSEPN